MASDQSLDGVEQSELDPVKPASALPKLLSVLVLAIVGVSVIWFIGSNSRFEWGTVLAYLGDPRILAGVGTTLLITLVATALGTVLGIVLAVMRLSGVLALRTISSTYVWIVRSVPLLVQIIFLYNIAALVPELWIPFVDSPVDLNLLVTPWVAGVLALALNQAAYLAEIFRGGLISVDKGQREAAASLSLTSSDTFFRVVLPQALRVVLPGYGNELITMLKMTSLLSVVGIADLLYSAQIIYSMSFQTIPLLMVTVVWYLILVSALSLLLNFVERRMSRGFNVQQNKTQRVGTIRRFLWIR